ncbi:MAG: ribosome silencing factor [Sneathiella sp.]|nr:ribosome silencing factor [Sneathiella sp.]
MNAKQATASKLRDLVQSCLEDNKAEQVVSIDLTGKTSFADYMVIANGRSTRQVGALADHLKKTIGDAGFGVVQIEGKTNCDWVLVDAGDVIVHLFRPEVRDFYNLEKIWAPTAAIEMSN